jgi:hypothetical protein
MTISLRDVLDPLFEEIKFDQKKARAFYEFQVGFVNKNEEHMVFFGGNLLGVNVVRFTAADYNKFFDAVVGVDAGKIIAAIKSDKNINQDFKVVSDELNIISFYCAYRFLTSPYLDDKAKKRAATDAILIYQYRIISSLLAHYFKYPADPDIAQATYAALSGRYLIKKLGSWQEVFNYRCEEILREDTIHSHILLNFNDDSKIIYLISDTQGRIRDMVKNIYAEFKTVHVSGQRIDTTSLNDISLDGQEIIRDKIKTPDIYEKYIMSVLSDQYTFIKEELIDVIKQVMPAVSIKLFRGALQWLSIESHANHRKLVESFVKEVLLYTIEYLQKNGSLIKQSRDLVFLLSQIRNLYLSSRSSDLYLKSIRDTGSTLIQLYRKDLGEAQISAIRTSVILYICLRAFTKHHYHG